MKQEFNIHNFKKFRKQTITNIEYKQIKYSNTQQPEQYRMLNIGIIVFKTWSKRCSTYNIMPRCSEIRFYKNQSENINFLVSQDTILPMRAIC